MRNQTVVRTAVLLVSLGVGAAQAQTASVSVAAPSMAPTQHWSVDSGDTVGDGNNVIRGQVGWPGFWADFVHGIDPTFDIGGRLGINYGGFDGALNVCVNVEGFGGCGGVAAGMAFEVLLRKKVVDIGNFPLALTFNPGIILNFTGPTFGLAFPIGAQMGFPLNDKLTFNASFDMPMYAMFGDGGSFYLPFLFGGGVEYAVMPDLLITFKLAMGPSIPTAQFTTASFALDALVGVAYRLPH